MMETTNVGHGTDGFARRRLDGARLGRVFVERQASFATGSDTSRECRPVPPLRPAVFHCGVRSAAGS